MLRRIRRLALRDFGLFADEKVRVEAAGSAHDLHIIVGDSGAGKTTLCRALGLALCGTTRSVSAASVSIPLHERVDGPVTATVSADFDAADSRYRVERTLTEPAPDEAGEPSVGGLQVQQQDEETWRDVDGPDEAVHRLAPPETEPLLVTDPGLHRAAQPTGWAPLVQGRLTAAAAGRAALEDRSASPESLWDEFRTHLDDYVGTVGPAPRYEVATGTEPFEVRVTSDGESVGPASGLPTGETIRFALAVTLAAGDCTDLPQWFDAPLGRLDTDARASVIEGFETAAERRQIVVLPHEGSLAAHPELTRNAATGHRLELIDQYRAEIVALDPN